MVIIKNHSKWQPRIRNKLLDAFDLKDVSVGDVDNLGNYLIEVSTDGFHWKMLAVKEKTPLKEVVAMIKDAMTNNEWDSAYKHQYLFFEDI